MAKINNLEQRFKMERMVKEFSDEETQVFINWGGELYRDGIAVGALTVLGVVITLTAVGIVKFVKN